MPKPFAVLHRTKHKNAPTSGYALYVGDLPPLPCTKPESIEQVQALLNATKWAKDSAWCIVDCKRDEVILCSTNYKRELE